MTKVLTDAEILELGYESTPKGWLPISGETTERLFDAVNRMRYQPLCDECGRPWVNDGRRVCIVCASDTMRAKAAEGYLHPEDSEPKLSGRETTQTKSLPPDNKGKRFRWPEQNEISVEKVLEALGACRVIFKRHGVVFSGRMQVVRCPFHKDNTPSLSLWTRRDGQSMATCHGACGETWGPIDLEAKLSGMTNREVIREWSL